MLISAIERLILHCAEKSTSFKSAVSFFSDYER
ncbi:MAG: hypothetical protein JWM11_5141 [Planctomycetaceae bacterium]|nr:hypothetical protein [Planctomycetaceae bacterium]